MFRWLHYKVQAKYSSRKSVLLLLYQLICTLITFFISTDEANLGQRGVIFTSLGMIYILMEVRYKTLLVFGLLKAGDLKWLVVIIDK